MSTYFRLVSKTPKLGSIVIKTEIGVALGAHGVDGKGNITIGPSCICAEEVDFLIDSMIVDLNKIRSRAKSKLRKASQNAAD